MREDEDQFRHYVPLLRRIVILVAVIAAIPVVLWTITAFVHTYVGPPKVPTFRPIGATASIAGPPASPDVAKPPTAAQQSAAPQPISPMVEAKATTTDAHDASPGTKGALLSDRLADGEATGAANARRLVDLASTHPKATDATAPATTDGSPPSTGAITAQQSTDSTADAMPAAAPLAGPIPLPRHRPRDLAMAQLDVPMPRPRPDSAGESASETSSGPLNWLQSLFHDRRPAGDKDQ
jgi:hypothetical protein